MNAVSILALLLLLLMIIFGGKKGFISYLALLLNFVILIINIILIIFGVPICVITFFFYIITGAYNLFVLSSYNVKTQAVFVSTIVTIVLLIALIYLSVYFGHLQGFSTEQQDETCVYSTNIGIDMVQFMAFTIILAVIAAIIDLTATISSPIYELHQVNPTLTQYKLFQFGVRVGREILATSADTIYLTFFGGQPALFIWLFKLKYSFGHVINSKVFTQEFISIILDDVAVAISIPITAWITAFLIKGPSQQRKNDGSIN